jgi:hypothetical protein
MKFTLSRYSICLFAYVFSWRVSNRQLTILWVPTVMLLSPNCSLIQMKQITNRDFSTKNNKGATLVFPFSKSTFLYIWCHFTKYFSTLGDYVDRIHSNELEIKDTTDTGWSARYWQRWSGRNESFARTSLISIFQLFVASFQQQTHMQNAYPKWFISRFTL